MELTKEQVEGYWRGYKVDHTDNITLYVYRNTKNGKYWNGNGETGDIRSAVKYHENEGFSVIMIDGEYPIYERVIYGDNNIKRIKRRKK